MAWTCLGHGLVKPIEQLAALANRTGLLAAHRQVGLSSAHPFNTQKRPGEKRLGIFIFMVLTLGNILLNPPYFSNYFLTIFLSL